MILPETIDDVRNAASIVEIISESVVLHRRSGNFSGLCPFHSEKTPSFSVREDPGYYHCFGCGASGNVISFVMETMGMSFPEAVEYLAARYGIEVKRGNRGKERRQSGSDVQYLNRINSMALSFFQESFASAPAAVQDYCRSRNLTSELIEEFGIGYSPVQWDALYNHFTERKFSEEQLLSSGLVRRSARGTLYDLFRGRLIFPVLNERREPIAFGGRVIPGLIESDKQRNPPKYVNSPETPVYQKSKVLYGLPQALRSIREQKEVLVVEGYMDVIGLWGTGVRNAVATCGTAVTERHISRISKLAQQVLLLFDGDRAGRNAAAKTFPLFLNSGVDVSAVFFAEGEDPDTIAATHQAKTPEYIASLPRTTLLEAYFSALLDSFGASSISELGAAAKGKVCERVLKQLQQVENQFEKNELIREAAFLLMVEESDLIQSGRRAVLKEKSRSPSVRSEENSNGEDGEIIGSPRSLSRTDRALLQAIIVHRDTLVEHVLTNPQLCISISSSTRFFVEGLSELMLREETTPEEEQKQKVMDFLKYLGPHWVELWREAYRMKEQGTDLLKVFEECRISLRNTHLREALHELDQQLREATTDDEKIHLSNQKIHFERKLRQME